jgi:type II secretory ATPase GspE/PulE/Tfp pilus assembly ATPase PilB-like protein
MELITKQVKIPADKFNILKEEIKNIPDFKRKIEESLDKKTTELLETIFSGSICISASDIHFEPQEKQIKIRLRIDGVLQDVLFFSPDTYKYICSRIKLLSGLKLNVTKKPQDGRFSIVIAEKTLPEKTIDATSDAAGQVNLPARNASRSDAGGPAVASSVAKPQTMQAGQLIEIRASSLPSEHGESIVLRILNPKNLVSIQDLGFRPDLLETFEKEIRKPNGMVIITGPTGSGKTTTLYAALKKIISPEIKIITIEDPIEYHIKGISQTQTAPKKGYDFANGLKSLMRQDPDVILVGEIRDLETVKIALQAALTGHFVFSTLHTNDAAGTIARLTSLGADPVNIGPALNMIMAQRLVRRVCEKCSVLSEISAEELEKIKQGLKNVPAKILPQNWSKDSKNIQIPKIKGCKDCNSTGYKKRIGIYEAFLITPEVKNFILEKKSISDLRELALKNGMITMYQDGLIKVLEGKTTIKEVERVTGSR